MTLLKQHYGSVVGQTDKVKRFKECDSCGFNNSADAEWCAQCHRRFAPRSEEQLTARDPERWQTDEAQTQTSGGIGLSAGGAAIGFIPGLILGLFFGFLYLGAVGPSGECDEKVRTNAACEGPGLADYLGPVGVGILAGGFVVGPALGSWIALANARKPGAGTTAMLAAGISLLALFLATVIRDSLLGPLGPPSSAVGMIMVGLWISSGSALVARAIWLRFQSPTRR